MKTAIAILLATLTTACGQIKLSNVKEVEITLGETNSKRLKSSHEMVRFQVGEDKVRWKIADTYYTISLQTNIVTNWFKISEEKILYADKWGVFDTMRVKEVGTVTTNYILRAFDVAGSLTLKSVTEELPSQYRYITNDTGDGIVLHGTVMHGIYTNTIYGNTFK
jgi:hypothetical protein